MIGQFTMHAVKGTFDLQDVRAFFDLHPFTGRDPIEANIYHVCGDTDTLREVLEQRRQDTHNASMTSKGCLVVLEPKAITVNQYCKPIHRRNCRPFVAWFMKHNACRITDRQGNDLTPMVRHSLDSLYGP